MYLVEHTSLVGGHYCKNSIVVPFSMVNLTALLAHRMTLSYFLNQSIPRMMYMPLESKMMRFAKKSTPLMVILIVGYICFVLISPPGELTSMVCFIIDMGKWYFATNVDDIKERDAPESNKTVAGCELVKSIPSTTSLACWASSVATWLTLS
jgi:hypothetical protein